MKRQKLSFTLIEILVVIGIILILAAIILPAVNGAVKKADETKAKAQITTLVNAIKQYEATYGYLPMVSTWFKGTDDWTQDYYTIDSNHYEDLIKCLQAEGTNNPKKQKFLDVVNNKPGEYNDPWGNPYNVMICRNRNGKFYLRNHKKMKIDGIEEIEYEDGADPEPPEPPKVKTVFYQSVIVWSNGAEDDGDFDTKKDNKDNIYSMPVIWDKDKKEYKIGK